MNSTSNSFNQDSEVHITIDDQQKINKFARTNSRMEEIKYELKKRENNLQNLQDAEDEMMIALNSDEKVPFMIGEVFVMKTQEDANESMGAARVTLEQEKTELDSKAEELQEIMSQLKADLYAKFGNNINLEQED